MRQDRVLASLRSRVKRQLAEVNEAIRNIFAAMVYCRTYRWHLLLLAALAPLMAMLSLAIPWLTKIVIDRAYPARDYRLLLYVALGFLALRLLSSILQVVSGYLSTYVASRFQYRLSLRALAAIQRLPQVHREEHGVGGLLARADRDVNAVAQCATNLAPKVATIVFTFVAALVLMLKLSPGITILVLAVIPVNYWIIACLTNRLMAFSRSQMAVTDHIITFIGESIEGAQVARLFSLNRQRRRRFRGLLRKRLHLVLASWSAQVRWGQLARVVVGGWGMAILGAGWYLVFSDRLKLGEAVALGMYIGILTRPFHELGSLYRSLLMDSVAISRVLDLLQSTRTATQAMCQTTLSGPPLQYRFNSLAFQYGERPPCLSDIDLELSAGKTVVLIGPTGGGKSTLLRILCGLEDRYSGQFLVDGHEFRSIDRDSYLRLVSWVPQTYFFFSDSIRDNLCSQPGLPTTDCLDRHAEILGLQSVIDATPDGYDTELGDRGIRFSVGQYQKLAALRATLKDAAVLLLDEVAASMDIESERILLEGIVRLRRPECLTVLVTHHISITTEPWIDEIVVLAGGRIVERGSSEQLRDRRGFYYHWLGLSNGALHAKTSHLHQNQVV